MKLYFDLIYGNKSIQSFMDACDLSDRGKKKFAKHELIILTISERDITEEVITRIVVALASSIEKLGHDSIFVGFRSLKFNVTWIKDEVQTISNGKSYCLFKDLLSDLGYEVETTSYMTVTKAKYIKEPEVHI